MPKEEGAIRKGMRGVKGGKRREGNVYKQGRSQEFATEDK